MRSPIAQAVPQPEPALPAVAAAPPAASRSFEQAGVFHRMGNFERAVKHYLDGLEVQPDNLQARHNFALLYHQRGLFREAIEQLGLVVAANPEYVPAHRSLAVVYMDTGRMAEARAELNVARQLAPGDADTLVNIAMLEEKSKRPEVAKETLISALRLDKTNALAHYNLARLYESSADLAKARHHYAEFLNNAGPEYGATLADVQAKVQALDAQLVVLGR